MPLVLCSLLLCACGRESLDLSNPIHLVPDDAFWTGCYSSHDRDARRAEVLAGWDEWFVFLPQGQRPRVIWGRRGDSNNIRLTMRDYRGRAAGTYHWDANGEGVVTFDDQGISEMIASHEFGHALLHGDDSDHAAVGPDERNVMSESLMQWGPATVEDLLRVCAMHPELDRTDTGG